MARKTEGYLVRRVWLAWGLFRRANKVRLSITSESLEFDEGGTHTVLPLADIEELDLDIWPNIVIVALWTLIGSMTPWWWYLANFNLRSASGWYHFRVRNKYRNELTDAVLRSPRLRLKGAISRVES